MFEFSDVKKYCQLEIQVRDHSRSPEMALFDRLHKIPIGIPQ